MSIALLSSHGDRKITRKHDKLATGATFALHLRVPSWCKRARFSVNGVMVPTDANRQGYQVIERTWHTGDHVEILLPMELQLVASKTIQTGAAGNNHNTNRNNWVVGGLPYATVSLGEKAHY